MQNTWVKKAANPVLAETDYIVFKANIQVTFHMIDHFKHLYETWGIDDF